MSDVRVSCASSTCKGTSFSSMRQEYKRR